MEYVVLPTEFFDLPSIADLSADHKLVLAILAVHPKLTAAAVFTATPYILGQIPLPPEVFWGVVVDLERRGIVIADLDTREIFILQSFDWHRAPAEGENTPWARQVRSATARIISCKVRRAVQKALSTPPEARLLAFKIQTNLLTSMPLRGIGLGWTASEMLVYFAAAVDPSQTSAGLYRPSLPSLAAFCSLPLATLLECIDSLAAARTLFFDSATGEIFSPARLRAAQQRDLKKIREAAGNVGSRSIFKEFEKAARRYFPTIRFESIGCAPGYGIGVDYKGGDFKPDQEVAQRYKFRHGIWSKKNAA